MGNIGKSLIIGSALVLSSLVAQLPVVAAGAPTGDFSKIVADAQNKIWDLSKIGGLQHQDVEVSDESTDVMAQFDIQVTQDGSGKLKGMGTTPMHVFIHSDGDIQDVPEFQGQYSYKGSISSKKGLVNITFSCSVSGMASLEGTRKLSISTVDSMTVNPATMQTTGRWSGKATAAGLGSVSQKETYGPEDVPADVQEDLGDGSWELAMHLQADATGKKITGTATVTSLSQGTVWSFAVKGSYSSKTDASKLTLTGSDTSKGSSLKVGMVGNDITSIQGKVAGQTINVVP